MTRRAEPFAVALAAVSAVAASVWLDVVTTGAQRAAASTEPASSTTLPGLLLAAASVVVLLARPGDTVGRLLGLVAVAWTVDGVLYGWVAYSLAHDTDVAWSTPDRRAGTRRGLSVEGD